MRVAAVQLTSTPDKATNLDAAAAAVADASRRGAELVVLPEMFNCIGSAAELRAGAEPLDGPTLRAAARWARDQRVWLVAGSIIEERDGGERANSSTLWSPAGELVAVYRKIHLFDVSVPGAEFHESATISPGGEIVTAEAAGHTVGLSICYDLRFPELYRILALRGAEVVVLPSAFTAVTGPAHWEVLVRARAIENHVFVVAANQWGASTPELQWHGDSLVVDPWGRVLARQESGTGIVVADLDFEARATTLRRLPSLANRQPGAYEWPD